MEISLAKPLSDKRKQAQVKREQRKHFEPSFNSCDDFDDNFQGGTSSGPMSGGFGKNSQRNMMNPSDDSFS